MQRPKRIAVFGVLSLIMGGYILIHNLNQLGVAVSGPEAITIPSQSEAPGQVGAVMRDTARAMRGALNDPVYRVGLGVKSALSAAMACVLIVAGGGLMRNRLWSIRLTKFWAWFAIGSALYTVITQTAYVVPNIPITQGTPGMGGAHYLGMGLTFILMCVFPILLLRVLPTEQVIDYLKQDPKTQPSADTQHDFAPPNQPDVESTPTSTPDQQSTWRDDPWNDQASQ